MGHSVTIGGERLGAGQKMKAYLHNYERSTHDLSFTWRSTMSAGTLVPFLSIPALPGDTFDIDLNVDVLTHPTIGPLFGTYKIQLDVFQCPIRLYQGKLHMNMLGIGMDMSKVRLPEIQFQASGIKSSIPIDNQQVNPSSILAYLGIRGLGVEPTGIANPVNRNFNAIPYLAYWDIYKNYYANKQEEIGAVIHKDTAIYSAGTSAVELDKVVNQTDSTTNFVVPLTKPGTAAYKYIIPQDNSVIIITGTNINDKWDPENNFLMVQNSVTGQPDVPYPLSNLFKVWDINPVLHVAQGSVPDYPRWHVNSFPAYPLGLPVNYWMTVQNINTNDEPPQITTFPLENIDNMRRDILAHLLDTSFPITINSPAPYGLPFKNETQTDSSKDYSLKYSQEGLALKTYQSDLFNNWVSTEWIDGPDGISEITKIDTSGGSFTIDELNMSKKVYEMLNRIAISGGSYDDWLDAVYTHDRQRSAENPMYLGGLIRNLVFQEVVSNSAQPDQPLGTLAGRGKLGNKHKGGHIIAKVDEPSYLMGIISITPNVDYSQGNTWDVNLRTLNDLHKPALDEIGFQDLITDQLAWFDTVNLNSSLQFRSVGKQPAWINYMTNVNKVYGNFADQTQQMYMVLNRRYDVVYNSSTAMQIKDLTTYIDPSKFNHIFADTRRDAQNFWAQIHVGMEARRKMSAKVMPNL